MSAVAELPPLKECKVCHRRNRAQQRRGMCHACYEKQRRAGSVTSLVSARPARDHIEVLVAAGWGYREIARAARIDRSLVAFIVAGREKINADTAFHICVVDPSRRAEYMKRIDPAVAKERGRKAAASLTAETKAQRARKAWETRRANQARAAQEAAAAAQRQRFELARERAERARRQQQVMAERRAEAQRRREAFAGVDDGAGQRLLAALVAPVSAQRWVDDALCAQVDPDLWFPEKGGSTRDAKKTCQGCQVREQCLAFALEHDERFGIWGGLSERERRRLVKESRPVEVSA